MHTIPWIPAYTHHVNTCAIIIGKSKWIKYFLFKITFVLWQSMHLNNIYRPYPFVHIKYFLNSLRMSYIFSLILFIPLIPFLCLSHNLSITFLPQHHVFIKKKPSKTLVWPVCLLCRTIHRSTGGLRSSLLFISKLQFCSMNMFWKAIMWRLF